MRSSVFWFLMTMGPAALVCAALLTACAASGGASSAGGDGGPGGASGGGIRGVRGPTSQPAWTFQVPEGVGQSAPSSETSRVAAQFGMVDGATLYCSSYNGHVYKLELDTGKLLCDWNVSRAGCYSAPLKVDGAFYVYARDKKLYRMETAPTPKAVVLADYSQEPGSVRVEALAYDPQTRLFFLGAGNKLHAVDASGRELWSLPHANTEWSEPMTCGGSLYVYDTANQTAYKYDLTDPNSPRVLWKCPVGSRQGYLSRGTDGQGDELVFVAGWVDEGIKGTLTAIYDRGPKAGTPKWGPLHLEHPIKSVSLWEGHDCLIIPAMNGKVVWRWASTGAVIRETKLSAAAGGYSPWAQVVLSGPYGIVMSHDDDVRDNHLFVVDLATGKELWRSAPTNGSGGCMNPIVSGGMAVTGTYSTGIWYAFKLGQGEPVTFSRFANERNTGFIAGGLESLGEKPPLKN